jgi:hypothetical protein
MRSMGGTRRKKHLMHMRNCRISLRGVIRVLIDRVLVVKKWAKTGLNTLKTTLQSRITMRHLCNGNNKK